MAVLLNMKKPARGILKHEVGFLYYHPLSKQANFPAGWAAPYQAEALAGGRRIHRRARNDYGQLFPGSLYSAELTAGTGRVLH